MGEGCPAGLKSATYSIEAPVLSQGSRKTTSIQSFPGPEPGTEASDRWASQPPTPVLPSGAVWNPIPLMASRWSCAAFTTSWAAWGITIGLLLGPYMPPGPSGVPDILLDERSTLIVALLDGSLATPLKSRATMSRLTPPSLSSETFRPFQEGIP